MHEIEEFIDYYPNSGNSNSTTIGNMSQTASTTYTSKMVQSMNDGRFGRPLNFSSFKTGRILASMDNVVFVIVLQWKWIDEYYMAGWWLAVDGCFPFHSWNADSL